MSYIARSNEEIKKDTVDQLFWDSRVDASNIKVAVSDGKVTLTGQVPSYTTKLAAETDSLTIPGVTSVVNNLEIRYSALIKFPSDGEIQGNIMNYFIWNPNIDSTNINVFVRNGTVTLEGSVDSYWQKILAEELASDMEGVLGTVNKLSVVPSENIIDESIAKVIVSSLDRNPNVDIDSINVEVKDGVVILSGTVSNWVVYHYAINATSCIVGVVNVINNLTIR